MRSNRIVFIFSMLASLLKMSGMVAQNYDLDSVYYTPIDKPDQRNRTAETESGQSLKRIEYFFTIQTGSLIGCNDCGKGKDVTFSAATVQGVTIGKKFRTGIGVGLDSYQNWQTLPLYGTASWDLIGNKNKNAVFLQMAYGWAHPWFVRDGAYSNYTADPFSEVTGGRMINPQIGYRIKYNKLKLSMIVGYKFQRIFYQNQQTGPLPTCMACYNSYPYSTTEITEDMNRVQLVMSAGWK